MTDAIDPFAGVMGTSRGAGRTRDPDDGHEDAQSHERRSAQERAANEWSWLRNAVTCWFYPGSTATLRELDESANALGLSLRQVETHSDLRLFIIHGSAEHPPEWCATALFTPSGRGNTWRGVGLFWGDETPPLDESWPA